MGDSRHFLHHLYLADHIPVRASAAVPISVRDQQFPVGILVLIIVPDAFHCPGAGISIVCIIILARIGCSHKMGCHPGSVNALPCKGIIGQPVGIVPAYLGGHERVHTGFL